jgi:hypothetical protein
MNKMTGGSCSTSSGTSDHSSTPMADAGQRIAASEPDKRTPVSVTAKAGALPDLSSSGAVEPAPDEQPQALMADENEPINVPPPVAALVARRARRLGHEPDLLVVANRLHLAAGCAREIANPDFLARHPIAP